MSKDYTFQWQRQAVMQLQMSFENEKREAFSKCVRRSCTAVDINRLWQYKVLCAVQNSVFSLVAATKLPPRLVPKDVLSPCLDCDIKLRPRQSFPVQRGIFYHVWSNSLVFQISTCLAVTLPRCSFGHSATLTACHPCNSHDTFFFLPQLFFCRSWTLREKKSGEHQEVMPHVNCGESRRQV